MLNVKKMLAKVANQFEPITPNVVLVEATSTDGLTVAKSGNLATVNFLCTFAKNTVGWHTLFTIENTNCIAKGTTFNVGLLHTGDLAMLRASGGTHTVISAYIYNTTAIQNIRGQISFKC